MADNNVEIRITGSLDPSVASSARTAASELDNLGSTATVSAKAMADALKAAGGDMSKVTPAMLGLASASASLAPAATGAAVAIESVGHSAVNSRAATESLVIVHEALQGRMSRIPGSAMILTQALTGASGASLFLGAGVVALAAGLAYLGVKSLEAANAVDKLSLSGLGTQGFAASEDEIRKLVAEISVLPEVSSASAEKSVAAFQTMHNRSKASLDGLAAAVDGWAAETGQTTEKAAEQLSRVFGEPLSASASQFAASLRGVTAAEIDAYNQARQAGDIYGAQRVILEALGNTIDQNIGRLAQHSAAQHSSFLSGLEYYLMLGGGITSEQAHAAMLADETKNWNDLSAAIHGATAELAKTTASPQQQLSRALIDADAVDTTRSRITELKAKVAEFQEALANPGATEAMKANFTSAIAAAEKEIDTLQNKQQFKGTGFSNAGAEAIAQAREQISEINADQTKGDEERKAEIQRTYADLLASGKLDAAQRIEVQRAANEALIQADRQAANEKRAIDQSNSETALRIATAGYQEERSAAQVTATAGIAARQDELARVIAIIGQERDAKLQALTEAQAGYSADSRFFIEKENEKKVVAAEADAEIAAARRQSAEQIANEQKQIDQNNLQASLQITRTGLAAQRQALEEQAAAGIISKQQELSALIPLIQAEGQAQLDEITAAQAGYDSDAAYFIAKENEKRVVAAQTAEQIAAVRRQIAQATQSEEVATARATYQELSSAESTFVSQLFSGRVGVLGALQAAGQQFVEKEITDDLRYFAARAILGQAALVKDTSLGQAGVLLHALFEGQKTGATAAGEQARVAAKTAGAAEGNATEAVADSASILNSAYTAAASAFKWVMQEVPFPANVIAAPVAAAGTFAAVSAFDVIQSFDVGTPYVPRDMVAQIHQGERIIPASKNNPGAFGGHTFHISYAPVINSKTDLTAGDLMRHGKTVVSVIKQAVRDRHLQLA